MKNTKNNHKITEIRSPYSKIKLFETYHNGDEIMLIVKNGKKFDTFPLKILLSLIYEVSPSDK